MSEDREPSPGCVLAVILALMAIPIGVWVIKLVSAT